MIFITALPYNMLLVVSSLREIKSGKILLFLTLIILVFMGFVLTVLYFCLLCFPFCSIFVLTIPSTLLLLFHCVLCFILRPPVSSFFPLFCFYLLLLFCLIYLFSALAYGLFFFFFNHRFNCSLVPFLFPFLWPPLFQV